MQKLHRPDSSGHHCSPLNAPSTLAIKSVYLRNLPPQKSGFLWELEEKHFSSRTLNSPCFPLE